MFSNQSHLPYTFTEHYWFCSRGPEFSSLLLRAIPMCHSHICSEIAIMILNGVCSYNFDDFWGVRWGTTAQNTCHIVTSSIFSVMIIMLFMHQLFNNTLLSSSYLVPCKDKTVPFSSNSNLQLQGWDTVWVLPSVNNLQEIRHCVIDQWPMAMNIVQIHSTFYYT